MHTSFLRYFALNGDFGTHCVAELLIYVKKQSNSTCCCNKYTKWTSCTKRHKIEYFVLYKIS